MFRRLLIANRGEVAARIARTAKRMGIEVVAVVSAADRDAQWLQQVDIVVPIGASRAAESYLDADAILETAKHVKAAAIHPGWGFLSENDVFADRCASAGLTFVGPAPEQMRRMGDKSLARATMRACGLDPIPGSREPVQTMHDAARVADEVGYPVLLKAVAGGGGRGMRDVDAPASLEEAFETASAEAASCFGDGRLYLERRIRHGRHIEVQLVADGHGRVIHLGERECSLQRRHQKVLEEARSAALSQDQRDRILPRVAAAVARAGYQGVGTIEMLLDEAGDLWFMEMNTRLQVEHSVTEMLTGLDLVELQLQIAAGSRLSLQQGDVSWHGHAIECRINAEDPAASFRASPGLVQAVRWPEGQGVRVDTHLFAGDRIPAFYDSMIAKVITHGTDRPDAIARMRTALNTLEVQGVTTNINLHKWLLERPEFVEGAYDTTSLEQWLAEENSPWHA